MSDDEMMWDDEDPMQEGDGDADGDADGDGDGAGNQYEFENTYFQAKDLMEEDPKKAIKEYEKIVDKENPKAEWGYKALKRLVRLHFNAQNYDKVLEKFTLLLSYGKVVTENDLFKGITKCLDIVSVSDKTDIILKMYDLSFNSMKNSKSDSTLFKTKHKLAKLLLDRGESAQLAKVLEDLHKSCLLPNGSVDPKKGSNLIDIYSIEIQLALNSKDRKRTQDIYHKALKVAKENPGILNSRLAIFHYCGGKIYMEASDWENAYSSFQEAFHFFEEAGNNLKIPCLKYILLANMLRNSPIDPFTSPNTANLKSHKEIAPMASLALAYTNHDITNFEKILRENKTVILGDPFIAFFLKDLLREVRTQVLLELIKPYTRIRTNFLALELNIPQTEVESLLVDLILDNKIVGQIDQVGQVLHLKTGGSVRKYNAIEKWTNQINSTHNIILNRLQ